MCIYISNHSDKYKINSGFLQKNNGILQNIYGILVNSAKFMDVGHNQSYFLYFLHLWERSLSERY